LDEGRTAMKEGNVDYFTEASREWREQRRSQFDGGDWHKQCLRGDRGQILPVLANALVALRESWELSGLLGFDGMLLAPMLKALPGTEAFPMRHLTDGDVGIIQEWMQRNGITRISRDVVFQAVDMVARENSFHPVRDYLENLVWDGEPRLSSMFVDYFGVAERSDYIEQIGEMFMISMVARVMKPGCKCDYTLVLEGPQGSKKSTACAVLGGEWFSDNLPDITAGKDVSQHLPGKWLIEISELSAMSRAENAVLKAFLTRREERYRPSYGRNEVRQPRQCVFIGTTNQSSYLKDSSGGRRFWPVKTGEIDIPALRVDRDQLFAEALVHYRNGVAWWPDGRFESDHIRPQQDERIEDDAWQQPIADYLTAHQTTTIHDIARDALHMETQRIGTADVRRIAGILAILGWARKSKNWKGRIEWHKLP
jgi:predicted P-loop ATPase